MWCSEKESWFNLDAVAQETAFNGSGDDDNQIDAAARRKLTNGN
jgi:hypothetical protein